MVHQVPISILEQTFIFVEIVKYNSSIKKVLLCRNLNCINKIYLMHMFIIIL